MLSSLANVFSSSYAGRVLTVASARRLATELLGDRTQRWQHSAAVAAQAVRLAHRRPDLDGELLVAAAWVHDIGYSTELVRSGFHPVDGALYLQRQGHHPLARLTAFHSTAAAEGRRRGLADELAVFESPPQLELAALTYCDMTSGPTGKLVRFEERYAEILERYGVDHIVSRSLVESRPILLSSIARFT